MFEQERQTSATVLYLPNYQGLSTVFLLIKLNYEMSTYKKLEGIPGLARVIFKAFIAD